MALGNFDGLHRGHMKIIDRVRRRAGERGGTPAAMTFDPHPSRVLRPDKAPPLLMTTAQKLEALGKAGMQGVAVVRFTHELSSWDPERFVRTVLVEWLHVAEVWVGANFLFGHDRAGTFSVLRIARRPLRLSRREDRSGPLQGLRRSAARGSGGWCPRGEWTRPRRCWATTSSSTASVDARRRPRARAGLSDRERVHRERARAAVRRVCHARDDRRRRPSVDYQYRVSADVRRRRSAGHRDASVRRRPRSV